MRLHGPDEPVYTIGVVARLLGISPQTLRVFEREGLVAPSRTEANIRLYSQNELVVLRRICELVKIEGVNIAGVRAVLRIERRYGVIDVYDLRADLGDEQEHEQQHEQDPRDQMGAGRDVVDRRGPR